MSDRAGDRAAIVLCTRPRHGPVRAMLVRARAITSPPQPRHTRRAAPRTPSAGAMAHASRAQTDRSAPIAAECCSGGRCEHGACSATVDAGALHPWRARRICVVPDAALSAALSACSRPATARPPARLAAGTIAPSSSGSGGRERSSCSTSSASSTPCTHSTCCSYDTSCSACVGDADGAGRANRPGAAAEHDGCVCCTVCHGDGGADKGTDAGMTAMVAAVGTQGAVDGRNDRSGAETVGASGTVCGNQGCWLLLDERTVDLRDIGALAAWIQLHFGVPDAVAPRGLTLSLDGIALPAQEPCELVRDGDRLVASLPCGDCSVHSAFRASPGRCATQLGGRPARKLTASSTATAPAASKSQLPMATPSAPLPVPVSEAPARRKRPRRTRRGVRGGQRRKRLREHAAAAPQTAPTTTDYSALPRLERTPCSGDIIAFRVRGAGATGAAARCAP